MNSGDLVSLAVLVVVLVVAVGLAERQHVRKLYAILREAGSPVWIASAIGLALVGLCVVWWVILAA